MLKRDVARCVAKEFSEGREECKAAHEISSHKILNIIKKIWCHINE
jgi:hypothetical protein